MWNIKVLSYVTFLYLICFLLYLGVLIFRYKSLAKIATGFTIFTVLIHSFGIGLRWIESHHLGIGHAPLSNLYESLIFCAWCITIIYLVIEKKYKSTLFGAFTLPFSFLAMAYASFSPDVNSKLEPLIPALKSNWLIIHVITCFLAYGAFAVACGLSIVYLLKKRGGRIWDIFPSLLQLDDLSYQIVTFGFLFLTIGIITGAVWADKAWGNYWSWDPKETWSLITWFIYAVFIHCRLVRGWREAKMASVSIAGFLSVLFTYFGVSFLLSGLHSYAKPG
jgi:cytochrome c-type biogenesis protein CcsB